MISRSLVIALGLALCTGTSLRAAVVIDYKTTGYPGSGTPPSVITPTTVASGITGINATRGGGLVPGVLANGFSSSDWTTTAGTVATATANGDYYEFGFSVNPLNIASLSRIGFSLRRSAIDASKHFALQYSFDGFVTPGLTASTFNYLGRSSGTAPGSVTFGQWMTTDTAGQDNGNRITTDANSTDPGIDLSSVALLQNLGGGTTVTFRLLGWGDGGGAASSNTVSFGRSVAANGLVGGPLLQGTITSVPETSSLVLLGVTLIVGLLGRRISQSS